ncbi:MAG: rhomboid family intramembrane serine protease [Clostridiales bacterium]|jgi:rhomboid protease GluP|nr:rhomboid family intramembrane serine protease [Clostridiales bacterium]
MNSYIKNLINKLYKLYNFNILEINQQAGVCSSWAVYGRDDGSLNIMFFSDVKDYRNIIVDNIFYDFKKLFPDENIRLVQVVLDKNAGMLENKNNPQPDYKIYPQCELILINPVLNRVLGCTNAVKNLAVQVNRAMQYIETASSHSHNINKNINNFIVTYVIIALNIIVYIITAYFSQNIFDSNLNVLVFMGAKVNSLISSGQYYRLFTCMFLHAGIVHLGVNMYSLYIMGIFIEKVYGKVKYIIIYFISGIASSIVSYMFSPSISVGASGAIFGLLGASLVFALKMKRQVGRGFMMNIMSVIVLNLIIGFSIANVDNFGHLGGLIGGILTTWFMDKMVK